MDPIVLTGAGLLLVAVVALGTVTHELAHAAVLRAFGVPYDIEWLPGREDAGLLEASLYVKWAAVTPRSLPTDLSAWRLRIAALAPLSLAVPLLLVALDVVPDPFGTDLLLAKVLAIGWMACALPSPQDFSLFFHAEEALAEERAALDG